MMLGPTKLLWGFLGLIILLRVEAANLNKTRFKNLVCFVNDENVFLVQNCSVKVYSRHSSSLVIGLTVKKPMKNLEVSL